MQEGMEGAVWGREVSRQGEDGGMEKNGLAGNGIEVSGVGHVSCALESPQERRGRAW